MKINNTKTLLITVLLFISLPFVSFSQENGLKGHILFFSSFDGKPSADIAVGDTMIYTAENYKKTTTSVAGLKDSNVVLAKGKGLVGDAIHFKEAKTSAIFYKAHKNVGYNAASWSGTVSFWLRLDPNKALAPHYCDPICITDSKWSDAGLWVDFTDHAPRRFRMGAMGDIAVWDPNNDSDETDWDRRTVTVDPSPFQSEKWTHVAMVFSNINTLHPAYKLYINGNFQGEIKNVDDPFTWEPENGKIMLGLGYIGLMDELAVFNKPLNAEEVKSIFELEDGIKTLLY
ncbi:LamG domain-containing protein [Flagellimonas flava]|uniref:Concanavalin A-like lectin/glucanases superfamily protein n=1 Tax=Flagellimonas flava TaxID=570519 RepID=A0A1M5IQA0_9FLAO|nr:LamG domain-containing protein [Allomuricauda flava]SHG30492.1 Concanavalin A-like lectin/glucanases superfamily protein [Allomuricauda flava]